MIRAAISTFGGVETGSSYQAGLAFEREIAAARAQDALHWQVKANVRRPTARPWSRSTRATPQAGRSPALRRARARCIGRPTGAPTRPSR